MILSAVNIAGSSSVHEDRDRLHCAFEVDGEWITEEMLCLANIVDKVADHAICLDEGQTKNKIHSNIWACGDEEGCLASVLGKVGEVNFEPNWKFCCNWFIIRRVDNSG